MSATKSVANNRTLGTAILDTLVRQHSRPHALGLAPGAARRIQPGDRKYATLPRGCPQVELGTNEPAPWSVSCCFERPTWGTHEFLRRRAQGPAVVGSVDGRVTSTLISCLVQPGCCNRNEKRAAWSKGRGQDVPIVTTKRREKSSPWRLHALTSEAI
jgi:hypothetical protein